MPTLKIPAVPARAVWLAAAGFFGLKRFLRPGAGTRILTLLGAACLPFLIPPDRAAAQYLTGFPVCEDFTLGCWIDEVAPGPDGNLWFTESRGNSVSSMTLTGTVTRHPLPAPNSWPIGICAGADGNLWFTEQDGDRIGRMSPAGSLAEFALPTAGAQPVHVTAGSDGDLWFTEYGANQIGRITPAGGITEFPVVTPNSSPLGIANGPNGNLWFTEAATGRIGRIAPSGLVTEYPTPTANSQPQGITAGPDGNIWFTELSGTVGRITVAGTITEFPPPPGVSLQGLDIVAGPDGNLWMDGCDAIVTITTAGQMTINPASRELSCGSHVGLNANGGIAVGQDGNIWFPATSMCEFYCGEFLERITLPAAASSIPALDWRGFAALAALLAGAGFFALKRL